MFWSSVALCWRLAADRTSPRLKIVRVAWPERIDTDETNEGLRWQETAVGGFFHLSMAHRAAISAAHSSSLRRINQSTRHLPGKGITMTIATSTTISLSIDRFNLGAWLSDLLLPLDEA